MKARHFEECFTLEQIPNVGPAVAADLRALGVVRPKDLRRHDPYALYQRLCRLSGQRQDPCMLDTLMAAVDFMAGGPPRPWWHFSERRQHLYGCHA
ncbi:MAG: mitomycin resistance protein [Methylibium sp.]|nr:mitomycin resistance protein [Methylibium sp.]